MTLDEPLRLTRGVGELIAKLEAATGPDRALDIEIGRAFPIEGWRICDDGSVEAWGALGDDAEDGWFEVGQDVPAYTASMDAALTLVPEGFRWLVDKRDFSEHVRHHGFRAHAWLPPSVPFEAGEAWASTGPLALCIAALTAKVRG